MKRLILTVAAVGLLGAASFAQACSLAAWSSSSGAVLEGGPGDANDVPRLEGLCSMEASGVGYVQDNSPADEPTMIVSFYYLGSTSALKGGSADLLIAYQDEAGATPVFTVTADQTNVTVTPNDGGSAAVAATGSGWNSVTVQWTQGGAINLWVNSDAAANPMSPNGTGMSGNAASTISSARLGPVADLGPFAAILFDRYESRRSQLVPNAIPGDANGNGSCSVGDAVSILNEFLTGNPGNNTGTPDRNLDGNVTLGDAVLTLNAFLTSQC